MYDHIGNLGKFNKSIKRPDLSQLNDSEYRIKISKNEYLFKISINGTYFYIIIRNIAKLNNLLLNSSQLILFNYCFYLFEKVIYYNIKSLLLKQNTYDIYIFLILNYGICYNIFNERFMNLELLNNDSKKLLKENNDQIFKKLMEEKFQEYIRLSEEEKKGLPYSLFYICMAKIIYYGLYKYSIGKNVLSKRGGKSNKKYQLYISIKNKYFIIYNNKKIYLKLSNILVKNNKLFVKVNGNKNLLSVYWN
jgi:hypothetical protein